MAMAMDIHHTCNVHETDMTEKHEFGSRIAQILLCATYLNDFDVVPASFLQTYLTNNTLIL